MPPFDAVPSVVRLGHAAKGPLTLENPMPPDLPPHAHRPPAQGAREDSGPHPRSLRTVAARIASEVLAPVPVVTALILIMAFHAAPPPQALRWAAIALVFDVLIPMAYVVRQVRRQRLTDHHIRIRSQRRVPMVVAIISMVAGFALMAWLGAPRELMAVLIAGIVGLIIALAITLAWKISIHAAVLTSASTVVVIVFGPQYLPLFGLLGLVAWSQVHLIAHTPVQVLAGAGVGASVAASVFTLLR